MRSLFILTLVLTPLSSAQSRLWTVDGAGALDLLGWSVCGLEDDLNGDQVPDVIAGAWEADGAGYVRVYSGADGSFIMETLGFGLGGRYGWSVGSVADRNGDGIRDLLVGQPRSGLERGSAWIVTTSSACPLVVLFGDDPGDQFGFSVANAGDVNADGTTDFVVGAPFDDDGGADAGSVRVYSGIDQALLWRWDGDVGDELGYSVNRAGDVDGDGFSDVIAGARELNTGTGYARIWSGRSGTEIWTVVGDDVGDELGFSVACVGNADGDAFDDFVVGAPADDPDLTGFRAGTISVYAGATGDLLYRTHGHDDDQYGTSVTGLGDVNGDGRDDFASGARHDHLGWHTGRAEVYSGIDGALLYTVVGDHDDNFFGAAVAGPGDVDGDGLGDLFVGAFREDGSADLSGRVAMFSSACRAPRTFCVGAPNSAGPGASISWTGSHDHADNGFGLLVDGAPPGQFGIFVYGRSEDLVPFGDGWLCLLAQPVGLFRLLPAAPIDGAGSAQYALDLGALPASAGAGRIEPGTEWCFQFWYRDPAGPGGSGFNASDALAVTFCN